MVSKLNIRIKLAIIACLYLVPLQGKCQLAIEINYDRETLAFKDSTGYHPGIKSELKPRMVFNDSFAFVYYYTDTYNKHLKGNQVGHKLMSHATFYDFIMGELLEEVVWSRKEKYLLKDTTLPNNWEFYVDSKTILNKSCVPALFVNPKGDSILIWYTKDLAFKTGPLFYKGIPGVILEVFDQVWNQHLIATDINERKIRLVTPEEGTRLSASEWILIWNARQKLLRNRMGE